MAGGRRSSWRPLPTCSVCAGAPVRDSAPDRTAPVERRADVPGPTRLKRRSRALHQRTANSQKKPAEAPPARRPSQPTRAAGPKSPPTTSCWPAKMVRLGNGGRRSSSASKATHSRCVGATTRICRRSCAIGKRSPCCIRVTSRSGQQRSLSVHPRGGGSQPPPAPSLLLTRLSHLARGSRCGNNQALHGD